MASAMFERRGLSRDQIEIIANRLLEREDVLSTGIGSGVAIPHAAVEVDILNDFHLGAFYAATAIDFDALDGRPVWVFFCLVGPKDRHVGRYVKSMSRLSRVLRRGGWAIEHPPEHPEAWEALIAKLLCEVSYKGPLR
jgi:mannitol/fructose-specific phosphotransferase system IIA component (Ntr-type)